MFTGIIEKVGAIRHIESEGTNKRFTVVADFVNELQVDQSIAHNGVCLTVEAVLDDSYHVSAVSETLSRSNLSAWKPGDLVNLERSVRVGDRLDGHIVQGHVDQTAECSAIEDLNGSWKFGFNYSTGSKNITVEKGSICVNGVSLTVVDSRPGFFSVAVIPYTFSNTNFRELKKGDLVNLEFDIVGKYVAGIMQLLKL